MITPDPPGSSEPDVMPIHRSDQPSRRRFLMVTTVPATLHGFLVPYSRHLRSQGWNLDAATGEGPMPASLSSDFDRIWRMPWSRRGATIGNLRALFRIRRVLAAGHYDLVHVHTPIAAFITRLAAASLGNRKATIVYTAHGFHFHPGGNRLHNWLYASAERLAGPCTDRLIVINPDDATQAMERRIVPSERLVYMPGVGIDLEHYSPTAALRHQAEEFRVAFGVSSNAVVFTMVAEFQPGKNHRAIVEAFARLNEAEKHLFLAGTGPMREQIEKQVTNLELQDVVHFLGEVTDVRPLILTSTATVLPSRREGLSRAVLESLSLGVPVIGGNRRGIRELIQEDVGILVEPDDIIGLAQAMRDVRRLASLGSLPEECRGRLERYSIARLLHLHDELYASLMSERGASSAANWDPVGEGNEATD